MAQCEDETGLLTGRAVVLEVADGCASTKPGEVDWKALAAGTSKGFDFSPNTVTSEADDSEGYVESVVTNSDFTISFEGEIRENDELDQYGVGRLIKYYNSEVKARRQPTLWVRLDYGPVQFVGYMVISALSSDGGTNDIVTFSTEFKVASSKTIEVNDGTEIEVTSITATPTSGSVAVGSTTTFAVSFVPTNATDKSLTVTSGTPGKATATVSGSTVTVTGVDAGSSVITVKTSNNKTATYTATVTA